MNTMILTKQNFGKKINYLYDKIINNGKLRINFNEINDDWDEFTPKNHKAWIEGKKELSKGKSVDFSDLLTKYGFNDLKEKYEKSL